MVLTYELTHMSIENQIRNLEGGILCKNRLHCGYA